MYFYRFRSGVVRQLMYHKCQLSCEYVKCQINMWVWRQCKKWTELSFLLFLVRTSNSWWNLWTTTKAKYLAKRYALLNNQLYSKRSWKSTTKKITSAPITWHLCHCLRRDELYADLSDQNENNQTSKKQFVYWLRPKISRTEAKVKELDGTKHLLFFALSE